MILALTRTQQKIMQLFITTVLLLILNINNVFADEISKHFRFGVLSFRPKEMTIKQWQPLAQELERNLSGYTVELLPMTYPELDEAAQNQQLDFILTNPEHYILLNNKLAMNALATMVTLENGHPLTHFAGVIFTRADRTDIKSLADLNGKTIASPSIHSLGGYLMQRWELEKNNVQAGSYHFVGMPHDNVIENVMAGKSDAGFIRTGVLESLARAGKLNLQNVSVLNPHPVNDEMPVLHSTSHYPEWTFSVNKNISEKISRKVALLLLNIQSESDVAKSAGIAGFNPAADYTPVEVLMLRLNDHPDELKYFNFEDVVWRYREFFVISIVIGSLILTLIGFLIRANRKSKKIEIRLNESYAEISLLLNSMAEGAYGVDNEGFCEFVNASFLKILGYENVNEVIGKHIHELIHHSHPDGTLYPASECKIYKTCLQRENVYVSDEVFWRKDGTSVPVEYWSQPIIANDIFIGAIATFNDITERQKFERELQESKNRLQTIIEINPECIQIVNEQGELIQINSAGLAMIEADSLNQVLNICLMNEILAPEYREKLQELHQRVIAGETMKMEFEIIGFKGTRRWMETHAVPLFDNGKKFRLSVTRDITERKKSEEIIKQLAFFDPLTNLPNRRKLLDRLNYSIALSNREEKQFAVFMLDLDKFKAVNDTLGHSAGDDLLKQVAERLITRLRDSDMVARLGGDEFIIVLENLILPEEDAAKIALDIIADLTIPFELSENYVVNIGASIGICFYPKNGITPETLIDNADTALYQAKNNGRGCFAYY